MSKEVVLIAIDRTPAMRVSLDTTIFKHPSKSPTNLQIALQCAVLFIQHQIFNKSSTEMGIILFGAPNSMSMPLLMFSEQPQINGCAIEKDMMKNGAIVKPHLGWLRVLKDMKDREGSFQEKYCKDLHSLDQRQSQPKEDEIDAGVIKVINFMANKLQQHCEGKNYKKRAFLFTACQIQSLSLDKATTLAHSLTSTFLKLNIIKFNSNPRTTNSLLEHVPQHYIRIFTPQQAISLFKKPKVKQSNPIGSFRGQLEIAQGLSIQVSAFKKVRREKIQGLKKYKIVDGNQQSFGEFVTSTKYYLQNSKILQQISTESIVSAYDYGPDLIIIDQQFEIDAKLKQDKCLRLLGFVDKQKVPHKVLMGEVEIVLPIQDTFSRRLFTSFIYSMIALNRYGIARYIPKPNKLGTNPKLVALIPSRYYQPHQSSPSISPHNLEDDNLQQRQALYLIQLPTVQDIRSYPFNSLKKSTITQHMIIQDLIEEMMLCRREKSSGEVVQDIKVQNCNNPVRDRLFGLVFDKALGEPMNQQMLGQMQFNLNEQQELQENFIAKRTDLMRLVKEQFKLQKAPQQFQKSIKESLMWNQILQTQTNNQQHSNSFNQ